MRKYDAKIEVVLNGKYKMVDANSIINTDNKRNLPEFIRGKINPSDLMHETLRRIYNINVNFKGNICGDCARMLSCPKVMDKEKRLLKAYPYITDGLELILIDNDVRNTYENAIKEYKSKEKEPDFYLDDDANLKARLQDNGIDVSIISVFGCREFVPDDYVKKIKTSK